MIRELAAGVSAGDKATKIIGRKPNKTFSTQPPAHDYMNHWMWDLDQKTWDKLKNKLENLATDNKKPHESVTVSYNYPGTFVIIFPW